VSLTAEQFTTILEVLAKIDQGATHPRIPGHIGLFFRQYEGTGKRLDDILIRNDAARRKDGFVSGRTFDSIELHSLLEPKVSLLEFPLGEVADTLSVSEELGGLVNLVMWLKSPIANSAFNDLRNGFSLLLSGDYRWSPGRRLTIGESQLKRSYSKLDWRNARCLKAVADDMDRPPHAMEYILDYRFGPPSLKFFRCICAVNHDGGWQVLPALTKPRPLYIASMLPDCMDGSDIPRLALLLVYREPWSSGWTIAKGVSIEPADVLAHAITWADFKQELDGIPNDGIIVRGIRNTLRESGLATPDFADANLNRRMLPLARDIQSWLRGGS
jgi:hypothetical protein